MFFFFSLNILFSITLCVLMQIKYFPFKRFLIKPHTDLWPLPVWCIYSHIRLNARVQSDYSSTTASVLFFFFERTEQTGLLARRQPWRGGAPPFESKPLAPSMGWEPQKQKELSVTLIAWIVNEKLAVCHLHRLGSWRERNDKNIWPHFNLQFKLYDSQPAFGFLSTQMHYAGGRNGHISEELPNWNSGWITGGSNQTVHRLDAGLMSCQEGRTKIGHLDSTGTPLSPAEA